MRYLNQLEYRHIKYYHNAENGGPPEGRDNVATSGCGLCSTCMVVELLTDKEFSIEDCVKLSESCGGNHRIGTDMCFLGPAVAEKFGLAYRNTDSPKELLDHLHRGGMAVVHVGVKEGEEYGLFTKRGHLMAVISADGDEVCILDPSYTTDKFTLPGREGKVNFASAPYLYCDIKTLDGETKPDRVSYHLFARIKR